MAWIAFIIIALFLGYFLMFPVSPNLEESPYPKGEGPDQDHFIKNRDAPVEMDMVVPESLGYYTDIFGEEKELMDGHISYANEEVIGLYYVHHQDEFWKYHMDNSFNRQWLKQCIERFGSENKQ